MPRDRKRPGTGFWGPVSQPQSKLRGIRVSGPRFQKLWLLSWYAGASALFCFLVDRHWNTLFSSSLFLYFFIILLTCVRVYMYTLHISGSLGDLKRASEPEIGVKEGNQLPYGHWESNLDPMEKQSVFLTFELFLQHLIYILCLFAFIFLVSSKELHGSKTFWEFKIIQTIVYTLLKFILITSSSIKKYE